MKRSAQWVAEAVGGDLHGPDVLIQGLVETDSRRCEPGSLYVARRGESADGHAFLGAAQDAGAVAAIVETLQPLQLAQVVVPDATAALGELARAYLAELRDGSDLQVIGITGSAGKTTTKDLLGQILSGAAPTVFPKLSFNNEVGCPLTILRADESTRYLVLEMGASGPGHLRYLTEIAPLDVAVELMVGRAHLGGFGGVDQLCSAKQELIEGLRPGGIAVLNATDPAVVRMLSRAPGPALLFSSDPLLPAQVTAVDTTIDEVGRPHFTIRFGGRCAPVDTALVGAHQVGNVLAAVAAALAVGITLENAAASVGAASALSPHRMDVRPHLSWTDTTDVLLVDDSYNANPDSMAAGLRAARHLAGDGRIVAVLGQMLELGPDSARIHREMASSAVESGVSVLLTVGPEAVPLAEAFAAQTSPQTETHATETADEVNSLLPEIIEPGDTLFLKGSWGSGVWKVADFIIESARKVT